jgi:preprotein translocase subunit YajC
MKISKALQVLLILSGLLMMGCLPDSFTKFEEDPPQTQPATVPPPTPTPILAPTNLAYEEPINGSEHVATVGQAVNDFLPIAVENFPSSYSISPALPAGLFIVAATGEISGTPTTASAVANYVITASNSAGSDTVEAKLAVFNIPADLRYQAIPLITLTVLNGSSFTVSGDISSSGNGTGIITAVAGNQITVEVLSGRFLIAEDTDNVIPFSAAETSIDEVNYSVQQKLKLSNIVGLAEGGSISLPSGVYGDIIEVTNATEIVVGVLNGSFNLADSFDDTDTFTTEFGTILESSFIYQANAIIDLKPTLSAGEDIVYTVEPALPTEFFDAFDGNLGWIQGTQNSTTLSSVTVTATNPVGSVTTSFFLGPEESAPKQMNFSQDLILNVSSTGSFSVGQEVTSSCSCNGGGGGLGIVKKVINANNLHIRLINGFFNQGEGIDNVKPYGGEKAEIIHATPFNAVLHVADGASSPFNRKGFISSTADAAQGIVSYVDVDSTTFDGTNDDAIYVLTYQGSFVVPVLEIKNTENFASISLPAIAVVSIEATNLKLKLNDVSNFTKGSEITTLSGATGTVNDLGANYVYVAIDNPGFTHEDAADDVDNYNVYQAAEANIEELSPDNTFYLYRNEAIRLNAFLRKGSEPAWSITPALPLGLTIDPATGHIAGTPIESSVKKSYIVTASNVIDSIQYQETFTFSLRVFDHFTINNITDIATSYILHKEGKKNGNTRCRITSDQIASANQNNKDIICRLEGEERDLFLQGMKFQVNSSPGLCEYVTHTPYNFYSKSIAPTTTNTAYLKHVVADGSDCVLPAGIFDDVIANECISNQGSTNCDTGNYKIQTYSWSNGSALEGQDCLISSATQSEEIACGGNTLNCREGGLRTFDATALNSGITSFFTGASSGLLKEYNYTGTLFAPTGELQSPLKLVNYVANNNCADAGASTDAGYRYQANNWERYKVSDYPQAGLNNGAEVTINAANDETSSMIARSTVTSSEFLGNDFFPGDIVTLSGAGGNHKIANINNLVVTFTAPLDLAMTGDLTITPHENSEPFKGVSTNPFYTFECADAAQDTKARIRIQVRDWDRQFSINDNIDVLGKVHSASVTSSSLFNTTILSGSLALAGDFTSNPENIIFPIIRYGNQVNQPITQDIAISDNSVFNLIMVHPSTSNVFGATLYSSPLLMDSGAALDLFGQAYNDDEDWDDYYGPNSSFVSNLNSCGIADTAPTRVPSSRREYFPFFSY